jgi:hypothetical protein
MKTEPSADLREAASVCWQMYVALTDQGFSEPQALTIIAQTITGVRPQGDAT